MSVNLQRQIQLLCAVTVANFAAQVVYFFHLYYRPGELPDIRSWLLLGAVFALFLCGYVLLARRSTTGYWLLVLFLAMEFFFYLWNLIGSALHGYGLFFQLANPDPILWVVFAIGYLNLFASGYFLGLLLLRRSDFLHTPQPV